MMTQVQEKRKREKEERDYLISYYYTNALQTPSLVYSDGGRLQKGYTNGTKITSLQKKKKDFWKLLFIIWFPPVQFDGRWNKLKNKKQTKEQSAKRDESPPTHFFGVFFSPLISPIIKQVKQKRSPERNDLAQEWGRPVFFLNNNNNKKGYIHIQKVVGEEREPVDAEPSVAKDTTRKICGGACAISSRSYTFRPPLLDIILYI